jgi:hypothetical protein
MPSNNDSNSMVPYTSSTLSASNLTSSDSSYIPTFEKWKAMKGYKDSPPPIPPIKKKVLTFDEWKKAGSPAG